MKSAEGVAKTGELRLHAAAPGDPGENDVSFATFPIGGNIYSEAGSANLIFLRAALALDSSVDLFTVNRDFFRRIYS